MDRFQLTIDLLTGVDAIDAQHRMLFELANQIIEPSVAQSADSTFFSSLSFLADYVQYHFAAEEFAMSQTDYPGKEKHLRFHEEFREEIGQLLELALEEPNIAALRIRFANAVTGWLVTHIRIEDRALASFLRSNAGELEVTLPDADSLVAAGLLKTPGSSSST